MEQSIKEVILIKAKEVFSKFGFRKTSLDDIARACGKGKSSLYYYFKNKEEIFEEVIARDVDRMKADFLAAVDSVDTPQLRIRIYVLRRMQLFHNLVAFFPTFRHEFMEYYSYIEKIRTRYDAEELAIIKEILEDGIRRGVFVMKNVEITAQAIIKAMKGFEYPWALEQQEDVMERDIDALLEVLFNGVLKRK